MIDPRVHVQESDSRWKWARRVLTDPDGDQLWRDTMHGRCDAERGVSCPWCSDDDKDRAKQVREARHEALLAMKSGPREYTDEQAEFIERAVENRQPLPGTALPIEDEENR